MWNIAAGCGGLGKRPRQAGRRQAGNFAPLSLKEIAATPANTGGPIAGHGELNADGAGVSFAAQSCDVEVDPETGGVRVVRYTAVQDAGKAVHPSYVEGQFQGGAVQGIGWALNEEYIYAPTGGWRTPGSSITACRSPRPADDRHGDRRGARTPASLRRARRRRESDRAAAGRGRQRHVAARPACG